MSLRDSFHSRTIVPFSPNDAQSDRLDSGELSSSSSWATMVPELLTEIIRRVESDQDTWPSQRNVVACACVCRRWREITREILMIQNVRPGRITFPSCLKQPGPSDMPQQCIIKWDKKSSTFYLYLSLTPSLTDKGKFLLAARRYRNATRIQYIISLNGNDLSQESNAYVGKLSSDFLGTNYTIYDSQSPHDGAKPSSSQASRRFSSKRINPQVPAGNFEVGQISYKLNLFKRKGPRRMVCSLKCPVFGESTRVRAQDHFSVDKSEPLVSSCTVFQNKVPRWHEHLQCWCLNFHGRVTVASVKNFQLAAKLNPSQLDSKGDEQTVLLQFGKVGDDTFTMDYRQPLSAFQAFAICLTSFGTKFACE